MRRTADDSGNIDAFERILVLILATEHWTRALALWDSLEAVTFLYLSLATLFCALALLLPKRRWGFAGLAFVQLLVLHHDFPQAGNHAYLELILCGLLAALDPRVDAERRLLLRSLAWLASVILFWSGVQKLTHGYYFRGEELAYSVWIESFRPMLSLLIPAEELARLVSYGREVGDGPYRVASPLFVLVSNAVYVTEIALALLLLVRRLRPYAVAAALVFLAAVEVAAREIFFGLLFANALLLFWPARLHRRLVGVFAGLLLCLLLIRAGILPQLVFY
jgi:hypothetical protein